MTETNMKSIIYISKRCPHCRRLLLLLQKKSEIKGSVQITCIDDEPYPKFITSVPSMVSNGELWNSDELFAALEGRINNPKEKNHQQMSQQMSQQMPQQMPQQMSQQMPQQMPQQSSDNEEMLDGYFNGLSHGSTLGFASIDDIPENVDNIYYENIDSSNNITNGADVQNDGFVRKNQKTQLFDNDYETMMKERSEIGTSSVRL